MNILDVFSRQFNLLAELIGICNSIGGSVYRPSWNTGIFFFYIPAKFLYFKYSLDWLKIFANYGTAFVPNPFLHGIATFFLH